ncbi:MATE family efflux transporter [Clostridiaceae bacterium M8S5]|nr:MATE family efflux transporter [Clostridiaceae bacterium M8S5]
MNLEEIKKNTIKSILKYSIPATIAMVLSSFVTIVDGYFVSTIINKDALAAMNLGLPILYVFLAVSIMIGVGGVSIAGRRLGEKRINKSINGFNQTLVTGILAFIILATIFTIILRPILNHVGIDISTKNTMLAYYNIMLWVYPFMMLNIILGMFLRGEGKHSLFMISTIITTILNIILDYLFIDVLRLGVSGAAYASGIAVVLGTFIMVGYFISKKTLFSFGRYKFDKKDLKQTITNGGSEFIGQLSLSITMFFLNLVVIKRMGLIGVAGMTIIGYSRYIYNMIVIGFGQGISPMISYSYGAKDYKICDKLRQYTSKLVLGLGVLFYILLNVCGKYYAGLFTRDIELVTLVIYGLRIFSFSFIATGYNVITSFYFTGIGYAKESAIISSFRGLILLLINICVLPVIFGDTGIWLIAPVTEIGTLLIVFYLLKNRNVKRSIQKL